MNNELIIHNVEQKSPEWIELRKEYITASDIAVVLNYLVNKKDTTYGKSIFDFMKNKLYPQKPSSFLAKKYKAGEHVEEMFHNEIEKTIFLYKRSEVMSRGKILASLDGRDEGESTVYEYKFTGSKNIFDEYKSGTHFNYFQLASQMYVSGSKYGILKCFYAEDGKEQLECSVKVDTNSYHYNSLMANMHVFTNLAMDLATENMHPFGISPTDNPLIEKLDQLKTVREELDRLKELDISLSNDIKSHYQTIDKQTVLITSDNTEVKIYPVISKCYCLKEGKNEDEYKAKETHIKSILKDTKLEYYSESERKSIAIKLVKENNSF